MGQNQVVLRHLMIHYPTSEASSGEQANEWVVQVNEWTDKQAALYPVPIRGYFEPLYTVQ